MCASGFQRRRPAATSSTKPRASTFTLPPEQAMALAQDDSPAFIPGAFQLAASLVKDEPKIAAAFRSRRGRRLARARRRPVLWHRALLPPRLHREPRRRAGSRRSTGVDEKLKAGGAGGRCGLRPRRLDADPRRGLPAVKFVGYDYHAESIERARAGAPTRPASEDRVSFEVASAKDFPGDGYDLVAMFDCLHDMGDPVGAAAHVRRALDDDGTWLIVEPFAERPPGGQPQPGRPRLLLAPRR